MRQEGSGIKRRARLLNAVQEGRTEGLIPLKSAPKGISSDSSEAAESNQAGKPIEKTDQKPDTKHAQEQHAGNLSAENVREISGLRKGQIYQIKRLVAKRKVKGQKWVNQLIFEE